MRSAEVWQSGSNIRELNVTYDMPSLLNWNITTHIEALDLP